eukprot:2488736-Pyramimonas_sp.AAC.1
MDAGPPFPRLSILLPAVKSPQRDRHLGPPLGEDAHQAAVDLDPSVGGGAPRSTGCPDRRPPRCPAALESRRAGACGTRREETAPPP